LYLVKEKILEQLNIDNSTFELYRTLKMLRYSSRTNKYDINSILQVRTLTLGIENLITEEQKEQVLQKMKEFSSFKHKITKEKLNGKSFSNSGKDRLHRKIGKDYNLTSLETDSCLKYVEGTIKSVTSWYEKSIQNLEDKILKIQEKLEQDLINNKKKEKKRIQLSNKSNQLENQIKTITEQSLPWALAGRLFDGIKEQIILEQENKKQDAIAENAREKAESFASINSKLGVVQKGSLTEAIVAGYASRETNPKPYPDFNDILEIVSAEYEEEGKKDDSLIEVLRDLANFNLFWSHGSSVPPMEKISNRSMVIDLHKMPVLKGLIGYLVIERLYKEMASLPDSTIKDGRRTLRTILVIDEAHNYLGQKNIFLENIIREGRSKGVVVFFASQSPSDYQQKFFNFQELLEFSFIFQSEGASAKAIQDILGCGPKTAKDLQSEIAKLEPFQVISRSSVNTEEFTKFTAEPFYKSY